MRQTDIGRGDGISMLKLFAYMRIANEVMLVERT